MDLQQRRRHRDAAEGPTQYDSTLVNDDASVKLQGTRLEPRFHAGCALIKAARFW
jgi:hypothetical protein